MCACVRPCVWEGGGAIYRQRLSWRQINQSWPFVLQKNQRMVKTDTPSSTRSLVREFSLIRVMLVESRAIVWIGEREEEALYTGGGGGGGRNTIREDRFHATRDNEQFPFLFSPSLRSGCAVARGLIRVKSWTLTLRIARYRVYLTRGGNLKERANASWNFQF